MQIIFECLVGVLLAIAAISFNVKKLKKLNRFEQTYMYFLQHVDMIKSWRGKISRPTQEEELKSWQMWLKTECSQSTTWKGSDKFVLVLCTSKTSENKHYYKCPI